MQPFIIVLISFAVCLAYGIYRAIQDVRQGAAQAACFDAMSKAITKMTRLSEAFLGMAKSTECANEAIRRFSTIDRPSLNWKTKMFLLKEDMMRYEPWGIWNSYGVAFPIRDESESIRDGKELLGYLSKDCIS